MPWKLILSIAVKLGLDDWAKRKALEIGSKILRRAGERAFALAAAVESEPDVLARIEKDDVA